MRELLRHLDAEAVVPKKDVPDACYQNPRLLRRGLLTLFLARKRFDLRRIKEEAVTRLPQQPKVASRIIVQHDADVRFAFVVLFEALDGRDLSAQRNVENIAALVGKKTDAVSRSHLHAGDDEMVDQRLVFEQLPLQLVHRTPL